MPSIHSGSKTPRIISVGIPAVAASAIIALIGLRAFPQIWSLLSLPKTEMATETTMVLSSDDSANFVVQAVKRVGASVVLIKTERTIANPFPDYFLKNPYFRDLFGEDLLLRLPREYHRQGQGSGFVIESQGIILTNAHVVDSADTVAVTLKDGRTFEGKIKGIDRFSDLAVVKIDGDDLPTAPLGNSDELMAGDWAIAVGNPLGLDNTVTLGIISTINRSSSQLGSTDLRLKFIQTDAAINPGNSGGPLLNKQGEVIGINTAILSRSEGIGFAIPINHAQEITAKLIRGEKISYPYIGIRMTTVTPTIARNINQKSNSDIPVPEVVGVLITQTIPDSPAETAGLLNRDVITEIDGVVITSTEQVKQLIDSSQIGQLLKIKIRRGDRTKQLQLKLQELPEQINF
ncbi:MAG: HhoA/HhoB/HtrA family serine endopeptidase [Cyanobacteria bacterium P01_A01_bin.40]